MSDTADHQRAMKKWATVLYGLAGVLALVVLGRIAFFGWSGLHSFFALLFASLVFVADKRQSRGCGVALLLLGLFVVVMFSFRLVNIGYTALASSGGAFYLNCVIAVVAAITIFISPAFVLATIRYLRAARTRIVWRNIAIIVFACWFFILPFSGIIFAFGLSLLKLPIPVAGFVWATVVVSGFTLALWKRLPEEIGIPTVVSADREIASILKSISTSGLIKIQRYQYLRGVDGEDYLISPFGGFGKPYRLTAEQFDSFMEREQARIKKITWFFIPISLLVLLLLPFFEVFLTEYLNPRHLPDTPFLFLALLLPLAAVFLVFDIPSRRKLFHRQYPEAQVVRGYHGKMDRFLFDLGARITGQRWFIVFSLCVFGILALMAIWAIFDPPLGGLDLEILLISGIGGPILGGIPLLVIFGKRKFQRLYDCPLTPQNLWAARTGEIPRISD